MLVYENKKINFDCQAMLPTKIILMQIVLTQDLVFIYKYLDIEKVVEPGVATFRSPPRPHGGSG